MNRSALIDEYNAYYKQNPNKWAGDTRDMFAVNVMSHYGTPESIIDVGCGNGHTLRWFGKVYPESELYGLDLSNEACEIASKNVPGAQIIHKFLGDLPKEAAYDWVLCLGVAEHFEHLLSGLRELRRITKQYCYLEVPHNLLYSAGDTIFRRLKTRSRQREWHLTREQWEAMITQAGFTIHESLIGENEAWEFIWVLK